MTMQVQSRENGIRLDVESANHAKFLGGAREGGLWDFKNVAPDDRTSTGPKSFGGVDVDADGTISGRNASTPLAPAYSELEVAKERMMSRQAQEAGDIKTQAAAMVEPTVVTTTTTTTAPQRPRSPRTQTPTDILSDVMA